MAEDRTVGDLIDLLTAASYEEGCAAATDDDEYAARRPEKEQLVATLRGKLDAALASRETVECEKCGFRYGAEHHDDGKPGVYTCPVCELASAQQDTERLDWLSAMPKGVMLYTESHDSHFDSADYPGHTLRQAIDSARGVRPALSERREGAAE